MANGETAKDLHLDVLRRCGEKDDGTSEFHSQALIYLNKCYQSVVSASSEFEIDIGEPWPWAYGSQEIVLTLLPPLGTNYTSSLTANFTFNSTLASFSSPPQQNLVNISVQGWWIQTTASSEWYFISSHVSGSTNFILDSVFNDTTITASSFLACKLDYTLQAIGQSSSPQTEPGGIMRLADAFEVYRQQSYDNDNEYKIYHSDIREFKRQYPLSVIELGMPTRFCVTSQSPSGVFTIRVNKYTDLQARANIPYIPVPVDLTSNPDAVPIIPRENRDVLVFGASYWLLLDKADDRAAMYLQLTQAKLKALIQDARKKRDHIDKNKAVIVPRLDLVNQKKRIRYI